MPWITTNRNFCCCGQQNRCCQPNRCCTPNCCCRPNRCCCPSTPTPPACDIYGAGMLFDTATGLARTIAPGDLAPAPDSGGVPVADTMVPLNVFDALLGTSESGGSLVIDKDGLYELNYYLGVQFAPSAPFEVFVMQDGGGAAGPIAATVEHVPAGPILLPRLISKQADACLSAGTHLSLYVRVERTGVLRVIPGALLSARRIGSC